MGDMMRPLPFRKLLIWMREEYRQYGSIFGIPQEKFYCPPGEAGWLLFGERMESVIGPAAGPHTQLAPNIVAAYLAGGRFFELKTVQVLDRLDIAKPCIAAADEGYNVEWSTELTVEEALAEYVKAWFLLHVLQKELWGQDERGFSFNMSAGYDLQGIKSPKVDRFIEGLKDAAGTAIFQECRAVLHEEAGGFRAVDSSFIDAIAPHICTSVTLSTMHGCPPAEIETICRYLLAEKKLHTFVKLNPTLLGYEFARATLAAMGYNYIQLKEESFSHDLQYGDGLALLKRLQEFAREQQRGFGVKLSNTLAVQNTASELPGQEMYMSGRALYPLTINLAARLAAEFRGDLKISYAGGGDAFNVARICATGIWPITVATTLLKPGGYLRLRQLAGELEQYRDHSRRMAAVPLGVAEGELAQYRDRSPAGGTVDGEGDGNVLPPYQVLSLTAGTVDVTGLATLAATASGERDYRKEKRGSGSRKLDRKLPLTDCFIAPCTAACPIGQDIPEYIRLAGEGRYREAYELIISRNPLPFITGSICTQHCAAKCTRRDYDEPVCIRAVKKIAAINGAPAYRPGDQPGERPGDQPGSDPLPARVAVIGAGPAGLAAGYFLARAGLEVTIFDQRENPGGTVAYVIPDFRIKDEAIARDLELVRAAGVRFRLGVDPGFDIARLKEDGFRYIFLAPGAGKARTLDLDAGGENIRDALAFLEDFQANREKVSLRPRVAVIGGGNTAMDAARAALRVAGVEKVYIIYRRSRACMPASREELEEALAEGVVLKELLAPRAWVNGVLRCQKMELSDPDASGRPGVVARAGEFEDIAVDVVLAAVGQEPDYGILKKNGIALDSSGRVVVDPDTHETSIANVFLGGDARRGAATIVEAIADGSKVARAILAREGVAPPATAPAITFDRTRQRREITAKKGILRPAAADAAGEHERCLECSYICNICVEVCPNRANIAVSATGAAFRDGNQILHIDSLCNECGNCATFCPYDGAPYKDKLTLFEDEADFNNSRNNGFLLLRSGEEPAFRVRVEGRVQEVKLAGDGSSDADLAPGVRDLIAAVYQGYKYLF